MSSSYLASRLDTVKPSPSMAAKARVDALRASGKEIVDLTIGEPDFPTPLHIIASGIAALQSGQTRYTGSTGTPSLRSAIAKKLARENGLPYDPSDIVVGNGAKHIIYNAFSATLNEGDEVIIPTPFWVSYPDMVAINGGMPVIVKCDASTGFKLTAAALEKAITPRTKWLVLNTPNNPTGAVYTAEELASLCEVLNGHPDVWLMTDEIYEHFVYGEATHVSPLQIDPRLIGRTLIVNGVSKAYAMTGWRIGYGAGPGVLMKAISLLLSQSTTCPSAISQAAATEALNGPQQCVREATALFKDRRDSMVRLLNEIPGIDCTLPDGAFYVFPNVSGAIGKTTPSGTRLGSDIDVMMYLLEMAGVATIDGSSYGQPGYLRMSFATSFEQIEQGCAQIATAFAQLR
ncbi:pyridoxal phosphate-dependent aminotransferase [Noviherbaspirillum saxi]|uniref:Aminotransferase n=1 Tax=Noviherbaspirillum saxi TaxID=2320863 RepID=A0A3A3FLF4_9BURK|nr:pyridoxal phosphate-dependent aminotransferase [Noviherbaspirillum saxi]RJF95561.1 pyridoxal phosphate-dependent aminotransferase [Noviherbaspirillum saxi]